MVIGTDCTGSRISNYHAPNNLYIAVILVLPWISSKLQILIYTTISKQHKNLNQQLSEWLLFKAKWEMFQLHVHVYHGENKYFLIWWVHNNACFLLDQHAKLDFYSDSSLKQESMGRHAAPIRHIILSPGPSNQTHYPDSWPLQSDTLSWLLAPPIRHIILTPGANQSFLLLFNIVWRSEAENTNWMVFGLTQSEIDPTTYYTQSENSNHYTTEAV
jgi:hypothetical protein